MPQLLHTTGQMALVFVVFIFPFIKGCRGSLLHEDFLAVVDVDATGGSLGGNTHEVVVAVVLLLCGIDFFNCRRTFLVSGHEDNETLAGIVHLVVDNLLDVLLGLLRHVPGVALCPDSGSAVVEQVIENATVAVVHEGVVARVVILSLGILDLTQVDVGSAGGHGDTPQAAFHPVALHVNVARTAAVIDADATAAVVGVGLVAVVNHHVVADDGVYAADSGDAVTVVGDVVVLDIHHAGVAQAHHVAHADAARHGELATDDLVVNNAHIIGAGAGQVNLGLVAVAGGVVPEQAVADGHTHGAVGTVADSIDSVLDEVSVLDDVIVARAVE